MKAILSAATAILICAAGASAQSPRKGGKERGRAPRTCVVDSSACSINSKSCCTAVFADLNLSADQKSKLEALCQKSRTDKAAREKGRRDEAKNRRAEQLKQIKEILTPEQYTKFLEESYLMQGQNKAKASRHGARPGKRPVSK